MRCSNCGNTIPDTASFCAYCGASIPPGLEVRPLFTSSGQIRSLPDMLRNFEVDRHAGIYHLYNGDVERWLDDGLGHFELARRAKAIRDQGGDQAIGLDQFLDLLREELGIPRKTPREILLRSRRSFADPPTQPIWHRPQAEKVVRYLLSDEAAKPVLLTGYGSFGGTYLTQWAIAKASKHLAQEMGTREDFVTVQILASLARQLEPPDLWAQVDQWVIEVLKLSLIHI